MEEKQIEEQQMEDVRITTIIVDTSAFHDVNSDFIGINSEILPSFFETLKDKGILLLTHPVLDGEIKKHIMDSSLVKNQQQLETYYYKSEKLLKKAGCFDKTIIERIMMYDVKEELYSGYLDIYSDAIRLNYPKFEKVFYRYFNALPPFAETGKKKSEFPDAVIIESVRDYIEDHPNDSLLVVSRDGDWEGSFKDNENVTVVTSIADAIKMVNKVDSVLSDEMMDEIYESAIDNMRYNIEKALELECFDVPEFEFETDFEIRKLDVSDFDIFYVPLKISRNELLIQTEVNITVSGEGVIYDEDRSIWDSEDKCYWLRELANLHVKEGVASVLVESNISFDFDNPSEVEVTETKLINVGNIDVEILDYDVEPIISEDDMIDYYDE